MLTMTVAMVRDTHAGMNTKVKFVPVLDTVVVPLEKRDTPHVRAAKPTMTIVRSVSRRGEDFFAPPPLCDAS